MKEVFEEAIKPLNDELAENLRIKKIKVEDQSGARIIDVKISYISHAGNRVTRLAGHRNFYKALGLMI